MTDVKFQLTFDAKRKFLRLFRALLRETTYLPDPVARRYHHEYILRRFRKYRPQRQSPAPWWATSQKPVRSKAHHEKLLYDCQRHLLWLYKAGNGDLKTLQKVLEVAYGRVGHRKHELLKPYILPSTPETPEELKAVLQDKHSRTLRLSATMRSIMNAQQMEVKQNVGKLKGNMRRFKGDILPEKDIWGRAMPLKRIANKKTKEMNALIEKIYPPLPEEEFKRLQDLATGRIPCPPFPQRRSRPLTMPELPKVGEHHKITSRVMQRLWTHVLTLSSVVEKKAGKTTVIWGKSPKRNIDVCSARDEELDLFANTVQP